MLEEKAAIALPRAQMARETIQREGRLAEIRSELEMGLADIESELARERRSLSPPRRGRDPRFFAREAEALLAQTAG